MHKRTILLKTVIRKLVVIPEQYNTTLGTTIGNTKEYGSETLIRTFHS